MTGAVLGSAWAGLVLAGAWRLRPLPAPRLAVRPRRRLATHPAAARVVAWLRSRTGRSLAVAAVVLLVLPPVAPVAGAAVWVAPAVSRRRARRRHEAAVVRDLPEVVDLFLLAVGAGLTVPLAVEAVARRHTGPIARELRRAGDEAALGRRLADALDDLPTRPGGGEAVRPLTAALVASERYGAPLADRLARLAHDVRADRRRRAEEAARRVPVQLLFPLVCCVLPAFALLTVAPLVAGALSSLRP